MSYDQLLKDLLRAFFREFVELFFPQVAARLDFSRLTFLDKELFTDVPEGRRREPDLVAQVYSLAGDPELILIHTELQRQRRQEFPYRMFEYYALLRVRHKVPVFPVAVYLSGGAGGIGQEVYRETLFGTEILTFRFGCIGLPDLPAAEYVDQPNPLAPALAALMDRRDQNAVEIKLASLKNIAHSHVDEARTGLLLNFVETYLQLGAEEQARLNRLLEEEEHKEAKAMQLTYEEKLTAKITEKVTAEVTADVTLSVKRGLLLRLLREKFGDLPEAARRRVESAESETALDDWLQRLVKATSLAELGLA